MTWDGIPENRNLGDDGKPRKPLDALRDFLGGPPKPPGSQPMPADPFGNMTAPAVATVEMFRAYKEAGMTEQQSLFFCACLVQVGLAIQNGGLVPPPDPEA